MNLTQNKLIIAGVAAVVIVTIIIVVVVVNKKGSDGSGIFNTQCNKLAEPIDEIKIKSCPDSAKDGFCKLTSTEATEVELSFTPSKWRNNFHNSLFRTKINLIY